LCARDAPGHLETPLLQLELAETGAPIARLAIDGVVWGRRGDLGEDLARLGLGVGGWAFFPAEGEEGAIGMKYGEIAFELVDEVKLHLCELGVVSGEALDAACLWEGGQ
jgi:hypothetical protein